MKAALLPVPFRNATLFVTDINGQPYTPMKPIVEGMGLDWKTQYRKLTDNQRFSSTMVEMTTVAEDGKQRLMISMPLRKLPGWMTSIHPNKVRPEIRDNIIAYQNECDDVLWDYWSKGQAINPRQPAPEFTLGSDTIYPSEQQTLSEIVHHRAEGLPAEIQGKALAEIWSRVHNKFRIARYQQLPRDQLSDAIVYVTQMELKTKLKPAEISARIERVMDDVPLPEQSFNTDAFRANLPQLIETALWLTLDSDPASIPIASRLLAVTLDRLRRIAAPPLNA